MHCITNSKYYMAKMFLEYMAFSDFILWFSPAIKFKKSFLLFYLSHRFRKLWWGGGGDY